MYRKAGMCVSARKKAKAKEKERPRRDFNKSFENRRGDKNKNLAAGTTNKFGFFVAAVPSPTSQYFSPVRGHSGPSSCQSPPKKTHKKLNKKVSGEMYRKGVRIGAEKFEKMDRNSLSQAFYEGIIFTPVRFTRYTFCPLFDAPRRSFQSPPPPGPPPDSNLVNAVLISRLLPRDGEFA